MRIEKINYSICNFKVFPARVDDGGIDSVVEYNRPWMGEKMGQKLMRNDMKARPVTIHW